MIILSSRKFRDNQSEILKKAMTEEVILTTLRYGSFRLVPVKEGQKGYVSPYREFSGAAATPRSSKEPVRPDVPPQLNEPDARFVEEPKTLTRRSPRPGLQPLPEWTADPQEIEAFRKEAAADAALSASVEPVYNGPSPEPVPEIVEDSQVHNETPDDTVPEAAPEPVEVPHARPEHVPSRQVYVDPSLLTMEELMKQEGIEPEPKKKGFLGGIFGHRK